MNDSTTAGYLSPSSIAPAADLDLDKLMQSLVAGLTGLPGNVVRPRYQPTTPKQPEPTVDWVAIGVTDIQSDSSPVVVHDPTSDGSDTLIRHERITVSATFYGPNGQSHASICRDGLWLGQTAGMLDQYDLSFIDAGPVRSLHEIVNQQARRRYDFTFILRRKVTRNYRVRNLVAAEIELLTDEPPTDTLIPIELP
jgi:hypothetical protein